MKYVLLVLLLTISVGCKSGEPPSKAEETPVAQVSPTPSWESAEEALGREPEPIFIELKKHFKPVRTPGPSDWLSNHDEPGQTYWEYVSSEPNRPDDVRSKIYLLPLEAFDPEAPSTELLGRYTEVFFGLDVVLLPPLTEDDFTTRLNDLSGREQILTTDILEHLKKQLPEDAYCLLGITTRDLYPSEDWNYVFGIASLSERVGAYSFARYDPQFFGEKRDDDWRVNLMERSCKVLAHEAGHMAGLYHCVYYDCLMNGSNHLTEMDWQNSFLCPVCLRKLEHAMNPDLHKRYLALREIYGEMGLEEQVKWLNEVLD